MSLYTNISMIHWVDVTIEFSLEPLRKYFVSNFGHIDHTSLSENSQTFSYLLAQVLN